VKKYGDGFERLETEKENTAMNIHGRLLI